MFRPSTAFNSTSNSPFGFAAGSPASDQGVRRVLILKRDILCADALRQACLDQFPDTVATLCRDGQAALSALAAEPHTLMVMGLTFSDIDGIELLKIISAQHSAVRILIVSGRKDHGSLLVLRSVSFGGFFDPFEDVPACIAQALAAVMAGRRYISPGLTKALLGNQSIGILDQRLTRTELRVFSVIGAGADDQEAADQLGITRQTVHTHRRNIMRKLGVSTSSKLVCEAIRFGVVRITPHQRRHRIASSEAGNERRPAPF